MAGRKAKAAKPELTIVGGSAPKARKASKRDFNKASKAEFLSVLAETCNVRRAAREAGVSVGHAYRCRKSDAAFRAGWREALGAGSGRPGRARSGSRRSRGAGRGFGSRLWERPSTRRGG